MLLSPAAHSRALQCLTSVQCFVTAETQFRVVQLATKLACEGWRRREQQRSAGAERGAAGVLRRGVGFVPRAVCGLEVRRRCIARGASVHDPNRILEEMQEYADDNEAVAFDTGK